MPFAEHLTATTRRGADTLLEFAQARWLWTHLMAAFPALFSLVLMADHLHLVAPPGCAPALRRRLGSFRRAFGVGFDVDVQPATTRAITGRQMRYGFNNPVRAGLVADPWEWPWSSLRDLGGVSFPVWTDLEDVAGRLGFPMDSCLRGLTAANGVVAPVPLHRPLGLLSPEDVLAGVASVLRIHRADVLTDRVGRRLIVQALMTACGDPNPTALARQLGIPERSARRMSEPKHPALSAVLRALSDPRLRRGPDSLRRLRPPWPHAS